MDTLFNKWIMLFLTLGIFILFIPGIVLLMLDKQKIGLALSFSYLIPVMVWAIVLLLGGTIDLIKNDF